MKEEIKIPKSLEPENIMSTIKKQQENQERQKKKRKRRGIVAVIGAAAAFVCILIGAGYLFTRELDIEVGEDIYAEIEGERVKLESIKVLGSYDKFYEEKKEEERQKERAKILNTWKYKFSRKKDASKIESVVNENFSDSYLNMGANNETNYIEESAEQGPDGVKYSETNVQTQGIDEADIVKTDGEYIYFINYADSGIIQDTYVKIYRADGADSELIINLRLADAVKAKEGINFEQVLLETDGVYLYKDTLILMAKIREENYEYQSAILFLDVSDKEHPVVSDIIRHEEEIKDSRLYGHILYVCGSMPVNTVNMRDIKAQIGGRAISENRVYLSAEREALMIFTR